MKEKIFDNDFFHKLNSVNLLLNMRLSQGAQGARKSHAKGASVEFSDFREYMPGDDFRRIDWNAYGRFNKFFIKVFMEEREGIFNFFLDKSKSMDFGQANKGHTALRILGALSYIVLNNLDRVYINTLDNGGIEVLKASSGKQAFQRILKELSSIDFHGETNLKASILKRDIKAKGVSIIISDFFTKNLLDDIEECIKYLAFKKQQIILVQILAKEEINPVEIGELTLVDSETRKNVRMTITPKVLKSYEKALKEYKYKLEEIARKYGAKFIGVSSEDSIEEIIFKNFISKQVLY